MIQNLEARNIINTFGYVTKEGMPSFYEPVSIENIENIYVKNIVYVHLFG